MEQSNGRNLEQLARLEWTNLVVDDDSDTVFINFDLSADANFARGRFSETQRDEMQYAFDWQVSRNGQIRDYQRIALELKSVVTPLRFNSGGARITTRNAGSEAALSQNIAEVVNSET
ncbi:MAG: hypothetical protein ACR2M8_10120 [Pyrinomonadaceae bacterium]